MITLALPEELGADLERIRRLGRESLRPLGIEADRNRAPVPPEHPFWTLPNVVVSPHMSGDFVGWRTALTEQFVANLRRWLAGEALDNVVDKAAGYAARPSPTAGGRHD